MTVTTTTSPVTPATSAVTPGTDPTTPASSPVTPGTDPTTPASSPVTPGTDPTTPASSPVTLGTDPTTPASSPATSNATAPIIIATAPNPVLRVAPAAPAAAAAHFGASLAFHADVSDVAFALAAGGDPGFVLLDSRSTESWDQGHVPGAIHLPTALIQEQAEQLLDRSVPVVTYCWGPGCNGAARAALALAELGFQVKEMLGGFEYWAREGFAYETWEGREQRAADPLTSPVDSEDCGC